MALLMVPGLPAAGAARILCETEHPALGIALERLRRYVSEPPFARFDYHVGPRVASLDQGLEELGQEGFDIRPATIDGRPSLVVQAPSPIGLAYGVVRLVRIGLATPQRLGVEPIRMRPALPIREIYDERSWDNPDLLDVYKRELDELFCEGYNRLDMPVAWWFPPPGDLKDSKPLLDLWRPRFGAAAQVIDYAHELGVQVYLVENPQFSPYHQTEDQDFTDECRSRPRPLAREIPYMLCPSSADNIALARRRAAYVYRQLPEADGLVVYFNDPGGCECPSCQPWGRTIVRLCREFYAPLLTETAPQYRITVTLWGTPKEAVAYVVDHLDELPRMVDCLQIPPTAPEPPYLICDESMVEKLHAAARKRKVVMQQFFDGVGFRYGHVNLVEHPMPTMIERNLRACLREPQLAGVYGSSFHYRFQRINTRLIAEWGINPARPAQDILTELGAEWFGPAAGNDFAAAAAAMERYWDRGYDQFFRDQPTEDGLSALPDAQQARAAMRRVSAVAVRNRERLEEFLTLAKAMVLTASQAEKRSCGLALADADDRTGAVSLLRKARQDADEIIRLLSTGVYERLPKHPWWRSLWMIGSRPGRIDTELAQVRTPHPWRKVVLSDGDFRTRAWITSSTGRIEYVDDAEHGTVLRLDNADAQGTWSAVASPVTRLAAGVPFRVTFRAKRSDHAGPVHVEWLGADGRELTERLSVSVPVDGKWHPVTYRGVIPKQVPAGGIRLRFVLAWPALEAFVGDIEVYQKPSQP